MKKSTLSDDTPVDKQPSPTLYLVATPIGNLKDITLRAIETLTEVSVIACEDTRRAKKLLNALDIAMPEKFIVHSEYTESRASEQILAELDAGKMVALVTDAGMPGISDPGFRAVKIALDAGYPVTVIPGPSAPAMAFAASGIGGTRYTFLGFLPKKQAAVRRTLEDFMDTPGAIVFFDPARRLSKTLVSMREVLGDRRVCVCREMTKRYEEFIRGTVSEVLDATANRTLKGECTVVVSGRERKSRKADD